jgi:hypothetical protein
MDSPSWTHSRAKIAGLKRNGRPDSDPDVVDARRDLRAARAEDYVKQLVDGAPKLSRDQLDRLASLLRGAE